MLKLKEPCTVWGMACSFQLYLPKHMFNLSSFRLIESNTDKELTPKYFSLPGDDDIDLVTLADLLNIDINNKMLRQLFAILDHVSNKQIFYQTLNCYDMFFLFQHRFGTISLKSYLLCSFYCKIKNEGVIDFLRSITNVSSLTFNVKSNF